MTHPSTPDPLEAVERFLAGIAPYDPRPDVPMASLEIRVGRSRGTFRLTERATRALTELLLRHVDPDNCGSCTNCGAPLDKNLHCPGCDRVEGIFGQTVAQFAEEMRRREDPDSRREQPSIHDTPDAGVPRCA